jgi:hypothetical protein
MHITEEQKIAVSMEEQQQKYLNNSLLSGWESYQQTKPINFWTKRWKVPKDLHLS